MLPLLALLVSPDARAATVQAPALIVWLEKDLPTDQVRGKANSLAGGGKVEHVAWARFAYGAPLADDPRSRYDALASTVKEGEGHWTEFDAEVGIARAIGTAVEPVPAIRDEADRKALIHALIWEGAAITKPYPDNLFNSLQDTVSFRTTVAGKSVVKSWLDAIALDPKHAWTREEFPDARSFAKVQALQSELGLLPRAQLSVSAPPPGTTVVIDGTPLDPTTTVVELAPGHHYAHIVSGTSLVGVQEIDAEPGARLTLDLKVNGDELTSARAAVLAGGTDLGTDVTDSIRAVASTMSPQPRVYVAAVDDNGRGQVVGWSSTAVVTKDKPATAILTGEGGGGVINYDGWSSKTGDADLAAAFGADLGFELGIYYAAIQVGASLYVTPSTRMAFGNADGTDTDSPAYAYPHAGLGVYLPRPQDGKASFLIAGKYGYFVPGILGGAVSVSSGIPIGNKNWVRITLEGFRGTPMDGFPGTVATAGMIRVGFASLL